MLRRVRKCLRAPLDQIKAEIGNHGVGEFLTMEDLHLVDEIPDRERIVRHVQSWDTAVKDGPRCDYSVGLTFGWHDGEARWYLVDVIRERLKFPNLLDRVRAARRHWRADRVLVEDTNLGSGIVQTMRNEVQGVYCAVRPNDGKVDRFVRQTDWIKSGQLVIPTDRPWFEAFRRELLQFPNATHDDQVDALTQFAAYMRSRQHAYLDTDPETGRRMGLYRPERPRREDRMRF